MVVIKTKKISKSFRGKQLFKDISIEVNQSDCYAVIGADNEGKTSIIHAILGLSRVDSGEIQIFGEKKSRRTVFKDIGFVPDELLCFEHMTGAQLLDMTIGLRKLDDCLDYAEELIEYFKVNPALPLNEMEEDMNKCIYIISALLSKPKLLILDEPFNFLTKESAGRLKKFIVDYRKKGNTVLIVNEDYEGVEDICTRFTAIKGRVQIREDERPELYRPKKLIIARGVEGVQENKGSLEISQWGKNENNSLEVLKHGGDETWFLFSEGIEELKQLLLKMPCRDFVVQNITVQEQIFKEYDWMEEKKE